MKKNRKYYYLETGIPDVLENKPGGIFTKVK